MNPTESRQARHRFGREGEHPLGDLGQLILLVVFLAVWAVDSFVLRFSTAPLPAVTLGIRLGIAGLLFIAALRLAHKGHIVISEEVLRRGSLVKDGAFARVRHPLYLASILFYVSLVISTLSLVSAAFLGGIAVFYDAIASYEEKTLLRKHGDEYRVYKQRVPKWIPRIRPATFD